MARPIILIPHLYRLANVIVYRKDYLPPTGPSSRPYSRRRAVAHEHHQHLRRSWVPLGLAGDDLRRPCMCAQPPSVGGRQPTTTRHPNDAGLGKRPGRHCRTMGGAAWSAWALLLPVVARERDREMGRTRRSGEIFFSYKRRARQSEKPRPNGCPCRSIKF